MPSFTYLLNSWLFLAATFLKIILSTPCLYFFTSHSVLGSLVSTVTALVRITQPFHLARFVVSFLVLILFELPAGFDSAADTLSLLSPFFTRQLMKSWFSPYLTGCSFSMSSADIPSRSYKR